MKPYRNIYIMMTEDEFEFVGKLKIPYTGEIRYDCPEKPADFDEKQDAWYDCPCDLEEFCGFKKVEKNESKIKEIIRRCTTPKEK